MSSGSLSFEIPGLRGAAVPVQVCDRAGVTPRNTLSSATMREIPPGRYFVTAQLPNGKVMSGDVEVPEGGSAVVILSDDYSAHPSHGSRVEEAIIASTGSGAASPQLSSRSLESVGGRRSGNAVERSAKKTRRSFDSPAASSALEINLPTDSAVFDIQVTGGAEALQPTEGKIRVLTGNVLTGELTEAKAPLPGNGAGLLRIEGGELPQFVEVSTGTGVNAYVALPAGADIGCDLEVIVEPAVDIHVRLQNGEADVLLQYEDAGLRKQSRLLAEQVWTADRLMQDKFDDPIAAAVGGYTLLRAGETDQLGNWARNLATMVSWLPDGLVIYAEYLAQEGEHKEALQHLLQLENRGLPLFSYGLSRALGRLRLYANETLSSSSGVEPEPGNPQAMALVLRLQPYASACEFRNPLTNFMGVSPARPGLFSKIQSESRTELQSLEKGRNSMARYPRAEWMPISGSSGSYTGGPFKIVHHTTEGSSAAGAFGAFRSNRSDPHFTVDEQKVYQHIDTAVAARALKNPSGGVQTNRDSAVQIEVVGFAHRPKSKATLRNLARLCRWIEQTHGVPKVWPNGHPRPARNGRDPGGHNRDARTWDTKGGHYGHSNVPENDHWDPGYVEEEIAFLMSFSGEEGVADSSDAFPSIPETDPGLQSDHSRMPDHHHVEDQPGRAPPMAEPSVQSREESRTRLSALIPRMHGDVPAAVQEAIAAGRIDPARFGIAPADTGASTSNDVGLFALESLGGQRGLDAISNPVALEAIVRRVGRPPMLIRNDKVVFEPVPLLPQMTEAHVRGIEKFIPSVGRVEFINHAMRWGGTGFVVEEAPNGRRRVVTNRHVAKLVARRGSNGAGIFLRSPIGARYGAKLDMREEVDSAPGTAFELLVTNIAYLADDTEADVALLEIEVREGVSPDPIPLALRRGRDEELVATIGYPAFDDRNDLSQMRQYYNDLYDVKRFAPGLIMTGGEGTVLSHDCTTLGGNSGSCLISMEQKAVAGLHFSGEFGVQNAAVSVETLKNLLSGSITAVSLPRSEATAEARRDGEHQPADLEHRNGYNPAFLGKNTEIPWPLFDTGIANDLARPSDAPQGRENELCYTHFGVLFSKSRKTPRVTAVNIDGEAAVRIKRGDDHWFFDLRIPRELQLGQEAYKDEAIDRGHMVRREDPNWGEGAQQANDDTFHYTNAALQHSSLNQGKTLWQGLENYILNSARTEGFKACVFTGPIFRADDPELPPSDSQVPQEFWKIVVMLANGQLHATGYLLSQGDLIRELLERRSRTEAVEGFVLGPYRTFQVAIKHIEEATGLSFAALRGADPLARVSGGDESLAEGRLAYLPLESMNDILLDGQQSAATDQPSRDDPLLALEAEVAALESATLLERLVALQEKIDDSDFGKTEELLRLFQKYRKEVNPAISGEEAPAPGFDTLKAEYQALFDTCEIRAEQKGEVAWHVKRLQEFRPRYEKVGKALGIPWWFIGITHAMEGSFNFNGHLHNGDPLAARTVQVPKGRPEKWNPPSDWESSAVDALTMKGYAKQKDWSIPRVLYRFESYNGWGYRGRNVNTPYLWSFSKHYSTGKFVNDGKYDPTAISKQCGAAVMLKALGV